MKLSNNLLGLITLFSFFNCSNLGGEPPVWANYYILVDENGKDFFDSNPDYDLSKLQGCSQIPDGCPISIFAEYEQQVMSSFFNSSQ